jgi:hypothetical protein
MMLRKRRKGIVIGTVLIGLMFILTSVPMNASAQPVEEWVTRYNGPGNYMEWAHGVEFDSEGNIYIAFQSFGVGTGTDFTMISYDPEGNMRWVDRYNGPMNSYDSTWGMTKGPDETFYAVGITMQSGTDMDIITCAYDTEGTVLWRAIYDGPKGMDDWGGYITTDPINGNIYITGWSRNAGAYPTANDDMITIAYDTSGNQLWEARGVSPVDRDCGGSDITVNPVNGNILVGGAIYGAGTDWDYTLIAYDSMGTELWRRTYDSPMSGKDIIFRLTTDLNGNIYVTGTLNRNYVSGDICTIAYDSAGNQLWMKTYDGPANGDDWGVFIAIDQPNRLYVSGWSQGIGTSYDFVIIAYDLSGNQLWVSRYDGPMSGFEWGFELEVSPSGNIFLSGMSPGIGTSDDMITVGYDPDGNLLWELRYNGPGNSNDEAGIIGIDPVGNLYEVGSSTGIGTYYDMTVIKYSFGPENGFENLIGFIDEMDIHQGTENSLISKLENAYKAYEKGNENPVLNLLEAFINEVEAQRGNKLNNQQANQLVYAAQWLIDSI